MSNSVKHLGETPAHLQTASDDEARELVAAAKASIDITDPEVEVDPKQNEEYAFNFHWTDGNGKVWEGAFVNRIQTLQDRQTIGVLRAKFAAALPYESFDPVTAEVNIMVAHMMVTLGEHPAWAKDLRRLTNLELVQELYEEVVSHEAMFHGRSKLKAEGDA